MFCFPAVFCVTFSRRVDRTKQLQKQATSSVSAASAAVIFHQASFSFCSRLACYRSPVRSVLTAKVRGLVNHPVNHVGLVIRPSSNYCFASYARILRCGQFTSHNNPYVCRQVSDYQNINYNSFTRRRLMGKMLHCKRRPTYNVLVIQRC